MSHGFRLMLQLVVTVAAAAVVARATETARRALEQGSPHPPRHRADPTHAYGPERAVPVIELEVSGELDDELSPTDRLLALRHAADATTSR